MQPFKAGMASIDYVHKDFTQRYLDHLSFPSIYFDM